jgi:ATP-dependent Clp protease, protease subunit
MKETLYKRPWWIAQDEDEEEKNKEEKKDDPNLAKRMEKILVEERKIFFWGPVEEKSAREVVSKLILLESLNPGAEIKLFINSPGGVVTDGMVIYDTMQMITSPVSTICMGMAASMGAILLSGGAKGKRYIFPSGEVMIHQPSLGGYIQGVSADLEIHAEQIRKTKEQSARLLAGNCGKDFDTIMRDFDRDYWMNAQEAINYGIVDQVLTKF